MHDNDNNFRWIDPDEAVGWGAALVAIVGLTFGVEEPKEAPPAAKPAVVAVVPCATIRQYGPGERWYSSQKPPAPACAGAVLDPRHVFTYPIAKETK